MTQQPIVLVAASGLAREVNSAVLANGDQYVVGVLDDNPTLHGTDVGGLTVLGGTDSAAEFGDAKFVVCAGAGGARRLIVNRLAGLGIGPARFATVVHPTATVPASCLIGVGSVVLAQVTLTADVTVGEHVVLMPQVVLTHDNRIGDFATICAGVVLGGSVDIGPAAYLGMNSAVRQDLRVGEGATLGMGSVLLRDLPGGQTWAGVPAVDLAAASAAAGTVEEDHQKPPGRSSAAPAEERTEI